ncbi:TRAP transporter large permease [Marinomonas algicola]|uniref:TRAP transporter large permease n=1 Tax=Marinomonas algicola TaxID=2773454 RepID=UPI00174C8796|nr:TRAP transporter large permease [Marinomonas algicola]
MFEALIGFAVLIGVSLLGVPLAFATLLVGLIGFAYYRGLESSLFMASQQVAELIANPNLVVVPIFILMGELVRRAGITDELYELGQHMMGRFKGGLAMATVIASGAFSTVCGSSIATAATMTKVALPPMRRLGYKDSLSAGTVAAGGTLGILIPPSVPMVIYCIFAQEDIGKMWMAGIVPGLLMMTLFILTIIIMVKVKPDLAASADIKELEVKPGSLMRARSFLVLFAIVLGGIYLGVFTPTEAASVGAFGAFLFSLHRGKMRTLTEYREVIGASAGISASIFAVASCALVFSQFVNISGLPFELVDLMDQWGLTGIELVIAISILCVFLGMVFEVIGILVLIIPIFLPSLAAQGIDLIWFGVIVIILVELGLVTPPLGINVFTVKAAQPDIRLKEVFMGVTPFVMAMIVTAMLILYFPSIAMGLPNLMR